MQLARISHKSASGRSKIMINRMFFVRLTHTVCVGVRFAASGWLFCPRFARAPAAVGLATTSEASTNLEQNLSAIRHKFMRSAG